MFFADIVGLSGSPPDAEIPAADAAQRLHGAPGPQNELNLREAWLRTELFGQRLALTAGRLDLTNYFDKNAFANDESTQFLSDALVNNQMLGLSSNGTGVAAEFDPKNGFRLKFGLQQSNNDATNLSDSLFTLSEVGYTFTPLRAAGRHLSPVVPHRQHGAGDVRKGVGVSLDQKLTHACRPVRAVRDAGAGGRRSRSLLQRRRRLPERPHLQPAGHLGRRLLPDGPAIGRREKLTEGYYNFQLTERLRLSFHLTHVLDTPEGGNKFGYLLPGVRLQAAF